MDNTPTLNPLVNTPLTALDKVVDSPHVLVPAVEKMVWVAQNIIGACFSYAETSVEDWLATRALEIHDEQIGKSLAGGGSRI